MPTRIGLFSDLHASVAPVREALSVFQQHGTDLILCPGDLVGYGDEESETISLLRESHCQAILGNHEIWYLEGSDPDVNDQTKNYLRDLPSYLELDIKIGTEAYLYCKAGAVHVF